MQAISINFRSKEGTNANFSDSIPSSPLPTSPFLPDSGSDVVGQHHVHGVVAARDEEQDDGGAGDQPRQPMQQEQSLRSVWRKEKYVADGYD